MLARLVHHLSATAQALANCPDYVGHPRARITSVARTGPRHSTSHSRVSPGPEGWLIEQFYEDSKGECGLDDYQGRRWDGLHRHVALVMLAYSFLVHHRLAAPGAAAGGFPPSTPRLSLPAAHRCILVWLFQDLVFWLIATDQIKTFRPRRI